MFTLQQFLTLALLLSLIVLSVSAWVTYLICNRNHWKVVAPLQAQVQTLKDILNGVDSYSVITVTKYDMETERFLGIVRFSNVFDALLFVQSQGATYNLRLNVKKSSGSYVSLDLVS